MGLVCPDDGVSLMVHIINVIFISVVKLVHLSNKVVPFIS